MRRQVICPACRRPMPEPEQPHYLTGIWVLSPTDQQIVKVLADAYPGSVSRDVLLFELYGDDPSRNARCARRYLAKRLAYVREVLREHGWTVPQPRGGRGRLGEYRLEQVA